MYHILIVRGYVPSEARHKWFIEFGDYDKETVKTELACLTDQYKRKDLKIISIQGDSQFDIDRAIDCCNAIEM